MKKIYKTLNFILTAVTAVSCALFWCLGGVGMKAAACAGFVLIGLANLIYAGTKGRAKGFPCWLFLGLCVSAAADLAMEWRFAAGAMLLLVSHGIFCGAFFVLNQPRRVDVFPIAMVLAVTLAIVAFLFPIEELNTQALVLCCGMVISFMPGKALSNMLRRPMDRTRQVLALGSLLFWCANLMLIWRQFAEGGTLTESLYVFTFCPGLAVIAHSLFCFASAKKDSER